MNIIFDDFSLGNNLVKEVLTSLNLSFNEVTSVPSDDYENDYFYIGHFKNLKDRGNFCGGIVFIDSLDEISTLPLSYEAVLSQEISSTLLEVSCKRLERLSLSRPKVVDKFSHLVHDSMGFINHINGYIQLIKLEDDISSDVKEYCSVVLSSSSELEAHIQKIRTETFLQLYGNEKN